MVDGMTEPPFSDPLPAPPPPPLPPGPSVSASEFVRQFSDWSDRAKDAPVYVLHHGRPRFALASVELLRRLGTASGGAEILAATLDALLEPVVLLDRSGRIIAAGRAARQCFGPSVREGASLSAAFAPPEAAQYLAAIVERVARVGIGERAELPAGDDSARVELVVEPHPLGILVVGRAAGLADMRDAALAQMRALRTAVAALPGTAIATIGARGYLIDPDPALARLTGFAPAALAAVRAVTLFGIGSRVAVGDAIEAVFAGELPPPVVADLLTDADGPVPVRLGLAPLRRGLAIGAVVAAIAKRG